MQWRTHKQSAPKIPVDLLCSVVIAFLVFGTETFFKMARTKEPKFVVGVEFNAPLDTV